MREITVAQPPVTLAGGASRRGVHEDATAQQRKQRKECEQDSLHGIVSFSTKNSGGKAVREVDE